MKNYALTLLISLFIVQLQSQTVAIELNYPVAWPGNENPLTIVVEEVSCRHLYIKTDNGKITPGENDCGFRYFPSKVGASHFYIYNTSNNDTILIEERRIIVRQWPEQPAEFAHKKSGTISRGEFLAQSGVDARISGFDMSGSHKVYSYEIKVVRNSEIVLEPSNTGGPFESKIRERLVIIQSNDEILFEKIMAKMPGEDTPRRLNDIRIRIMK
ncbi:MAG: hypothetical protein K9I85_16225 [Saprospiraceae bacterium]|nr:hypothetical protein [Saprospiraceae bacterium]